MTTARNHGAARFDEGCRCQTCVDADARRVARWERQQETLAHGLPPHVEHGTPSAYHYWGCRCPDCAAANALIQATSREARMEYVRVHGRAPAAVKHGYAAYVNWGCRCPTCAEAARETNAVTNARRLSKAGRLEHDRERREQRYALVATFGLPPRVKHGTANAYNYWGCRCGRCRLGRRAARR